jgi:hydrogenase maturation factor
VTHRRGVAMRVLAVDSVSSLARCAGTDAIARVVETALVAPVEAGDVLLVDHGIALLRLDDEWQP